MEGIFWSGVHGRDRSSIRVTAIPNFETSPQFWLLPLVVLSIHILIVPLSLPSPALSALFSLNI